MPAPRRGVDGMAFHGTEEEYLAFIGRLGVTSESPTARGSAQRTHRDRTTSARQNDSEARRSPRAPPLPARGSDRRSNPPTAVSSRGSSQAPIQVTVSDLVPPQQDTPLNILANRFCRLQTDGAIRHYIMSDIFRAMSEPNIFKSQGPNGAIEMWERIRGHVFLYHVDHLTQSSSFDSLLMASIALATNFPNVGDEAKFSAESGFASFCTKHDAAMRAMIDKNHKANWQKRPKYQSGHVGVNGSSFARNLPLYCPNVLNNPILAQIGILQKLYSHYMARFLKTGYRTITIEVNRKEAFDESSDILLKSSIEALYGGISSARFKNEEAYGSGVVRDWFTEVCRQIFNPDYGLFTFDEESGTSRISEMSIHQDGYQYLYRAIGRFIALSLVHENPIGVKLPIWFFCYILGDSVRLEDISEDESALHNSLKQMLAAPHDQLELYEMDINGKTYIPTRENRKGIVAKRLAALMPVTVRVQFEAVRAGFNDLVPISLIQRMVSGSDLRAIINGDPTIDVEEMIRHISITGGTRDSAQVQWMVALLRSLDQEKLRMFFRFTTGSSQVPVGGFGNLPRKIQISLGGSPDRLPTAATCFYLFRLPLYQTEQGLREKVLMALANSGNGAMLVQ